jgi:hypothetical protein
MRAIENQVISDVRRCINLYGKEGQLMLLLTLLKTLPKLLPTVVTAPMMTTAINEAMRPYSMAVAADSSRKSLLNNTFMMNDPNLHVALASEPPFSPNNDVICTFIHI